MKKILSLVVLSLVVGNLLGCGQTQSTSSSGSAASGDYSRATSDLQNVATGLQSSGGNTTKSTNTSGSSAGGSTQIKSLGFKPSHVTPEGASWRTYIYNYTWTTTMGATVTEEGSMATRFLDSLNNPMDNAVSIEVQQSGMPKITYASKMQTHQHFSSQDYQGVMTMTNSFPASFSLPLSMSSTAEGSITFPGTTTSTFEILSMSLTISVTSTTEGSVSGSMDWGYRAPVSVYAYYYGTVSMSINALNSTQPAAMTGDVYQDLTNDGVKNGTKVGTIAIDPSTGTIKITLDNGTVIYAGSSGS